MKLSVLAAGLALCLAGFGTAYAQQNSSDNNVEWIGSRTPSAPESPATARYEAQSVLRQARQDCQRESAQNRKDCMQSAQHDYDNMMASIRQQSRSSNRGASYESGSSRGHNRSTSKP